MAESVLAPSLVSRNSPSSSTPGGPPCASRSIRGGLDPWRGGRGKRREEGGGGREEGAAAVARRGGAEGGEGRARREGGREEAMMSIKWLIKY
jgi:hypothetical protein